MSCAWWRRFSIIAAQKSRLAGFRRARWFWLALVFVPHFGTQTTARTAGSDARRDFQPSELVKIALIIMLAVVLRPVSAENEHVQARHYFPGIIIAVVLGLIFVEPDRGQTILLAAISGTMLLVAGVRWRHVFIPVVVGAAGLAFSLLHDSMRRDEFPPGCTRRVHASGAALQARQAMYGLGSGGWTGLGLGNGVQKIRLVA